MIWEFDGVSKSEKAVIRELDDSYAHPMGVVVFGADSGLKAKVYKRLRSKLNKPLAFDRVSLDGYIGQIKAAFRRGHSVLICLSGDDSVHHGERYNVEKRLAKLGAKSVVAVYAEASKDDHPDFGYIDRQGITYSKYLRQIDKLKNDPPAYGGSDAFIVVRKSMPQD